MQNESGMRFERVTIYWLPRGDSRLAMLGREWFGAVPETGAFMLARKDHGLGELAERATAVPRRYTLHGTLKAPFSLCDGADLNDLVNELRNFCARRRRRTVGPLRLRRMGSYLALMPEGGTAELDWLADECVTHFDHFRAPLTESDRKRRHPERLSARQCAQLDQFGYPYVLSDFRFHVTLAGPLEPDELNQVERALAPVFAPALKNPLEINSICLLGDPGQAAPFRLIERFPLLA